MRVPARGYAQGLVLAALLFAAATLSATAAPQGPPAQDSTVRPISLDLWRAARENAEACDTAGKIVEALQHYLESVRQAEGLDRPDLAAWGKNNAAYMIIKMFWKDPSVDLAPARRLLEEGLDIQAATEDCRKCLERNLAYVKSVLEKSA